ncbi:pyroglutamyl-peptidase I [Aminivibrio sp.]|uniref:pyroglutamyl-peptidase I n=1 Tax=Aminivibrio sp. TaxID=1872489 RepID=UPI001A4093F9|nr:pyroglutamyl-peptidase I [Aminivibrio sp.]MBL3540711.1 pyroglutamyl-peptidase I [Aminivibrio sp.]MDK2958158.1 pyroglutamyl-peptidase [Synergistaceae bacterium]
MKVLVTGFDPFGDEPVNPAFEAVKLLPRTIAGADVDILEIPTVFHKSIEAIVKRAEETGADRILMVGQAGGRFEITVERVGINVDDARIPDNEGNRPIDVPIDPDGPAAHFATLPVKAMTERIRSRGIPAKVSNTAGTFVCNHVLYGVLNAAAKKGLPVKAGFIHVPYLPEQAAKKDSVPSMSAATIAAALEAALEAVVTTGDDVKISGGREH